MMIQVGLELHLNTPHDQDLCGQTVLARYAIESNHKQQLTFAEYGQIFRRHPKMERAVPDRQVTYDVVISPAPHSLELRLLFSNREPWSNSIESNALSCSRCCCASSMSKDAWGLCNAACERTTVPRRPTAIELETSKLKRSIETNL